MSDLRRILAGAAMICGLAAGPALASPAQDVIAKFDTDHDNTLDLAEVKAAAAHHFAKLDKDGDGTLDAAELKGAMGPARLKEADPDHDGTLTKDEYVSFAEKLFHEADVNHQGTLDAAALGAPTGHKLLALLGAGEPHAS